MYTGASVANISLALERHSTMIGAARALSGGRNVLEESMSKHGAVRSNAVQSKTVERR
jgi:hypothetical protein